MKAIIKIGGSLQGSSYLGKVCEVLDSVSKDHRLVIVPGGGRFADLVRESQEEHGLSDEVAHQMAIKGMEMYGLALGELCSEFSTTQDLEVAKEGRIIFMPLEAVEQSDDLEASWRVTSDSIAAWLCQKLGFDNLILVKRVNGIQDDSLLSQISVEELESLDQDVVDSKFSKILKKSEIRCWIVNGEYPHRIEKILQNKTVKGTKIV